MSIYLAAIGNGTADDTVAFTLAQDRLGPNGGEIIVPAGEYRITADILPRTKVRWVGEGRESSVIVADGCHGFVHEPATDPARNHGRSMSWQDIGVRGDYSPGKSGFRLAWTHWWQMQRVTVEGFVGDGIHLHDTYTNSIRDSLILDNDGSGIHVGRYANALTVDGCEIRRNNEAGITALGESKARVWTLRIVGGAIEDNRTAGLDLVDNVTGLVVSGVHFERNRQGNRGAASPTVGYHIKLASGGQSAIRGGTISGNVFGAIKAKDGGYDIWVRNVDGMVIGPNAHAGPSTGPILTDPKGAISNLSIVPTHDKYAANSI